MNRLTFTIYRILVPKPVRTIILKKKLRKKILRHFASIAEEEINEEQKEVLRYLEQNPVSTFPYSFRGKYHPGDIEVLYDPDNRMHYVIFDGKRLYFKKRWGKKRIRRSWSELLKEQDPGSPHRYLTESFSTSINDVVADIGAAEGNFALSVADKVKKIYLFEYDREWTEALKITFAPWKDKVEIINSYMGDSDNGKHIRFDTFFREKKDVTFLKIDVDGFEKKVLDGCSEVFESSTPLKIALCTYHNTDDEKEFTKLLESKGFDVSPSRGYIIFYYDKKIKAPWLRRGLIRAVRQ
jgi:hypothetical protein